MSKRNRIYRSLLAVTLIILSLAIPVNMLFAQGATLELSGPNEVPDDQAFDLYFRLHSPAELISFKIVLDYDPAVLQFEAVESPYISYDADASTGNQLTFRTSGQNIPEGVIDLGSIGFQPLKTGNTRVSVVSISAFAAGDLIVRADATQSQVLAIVEVGNYIPVPTITASVNPSGTTTITEPINTTSTSESSVIESESFETTEEEAMTEATNETSEALSETIESTSEITSDITEPETIVTKTDDTNSSSTTAEETSTISTETADTENSTVKNTDADDDSSDVIHNGFRIGIPIILLLLVASIITTAIMSRRK